MGNMQTDRLIAAFGVFAEGRIRRRVLRIEPRQRVDIGPAVTGAFFDAVELLVLFIVAEPVDAVVETVELVALGFEPVADRVAKTRREHGPVGAVGGHGDDRRVFLVGLSAGVAGRADRNVELPVRTHDDHPIGVLATRREVLCDRFERTESAIRLARGAEHFVDRHQVDGVTVDLDPVHSFALGHDALLVRGTIAIGVTQHQDIAVLSAGDIDCAVIGDTDHAGIFQIPREHVDLEPVRQGEPGHTLFAPIDGNGLDHMPDDLDALTATILFGRWFAAARPGLRRGKLRHRE